MLLLADPDEVDATDPDEVDATDPDGMGASAALGPAVARIYRNTSQKRQVRLGSSAHIFVNVSKGKQNLLVCQKVE